MKLHYYEETDSLYIDLSERPGAESKEVAPGVVWILMRTGVWWASTSITPARS